MIRKDLRAENYALEQEAQRRCETCLLVYRLSAENFPRNGRGGLRYVCRRCYCERQRAIYAADPELRAATNANSRRNYQLHREQRKAQTARYRARHREQINNRKWGHYQENRQAILRRRHEQYVENPESRRESQRVYRARRKAAKFARLLKGAPPCPVTP